MQTVLVKHYKSLDGVIHETLERARRSDKIYKLEDKQAKCKHLKFKKS